jgi:ABC-2 type transport system permease protein
MILAVLKIMWLRLWRDKGALVLAFILPGFIFAIFAAIFSTASGGSLDLRVAYLGQNETPVARQISDKIRNEATFDIIEKNDWTIENVKDQVRLGQADVGLVIKNASPDGTLRFLIIQDPNREVAATVIKGQVRQILVSESGAETPDMFETVSAMSAGDENAGPSDKSVTYYVGATAILFIMFAAMQGASISIEERRSGISERLMVGPSGAFRVLLGKFLFLTLIGLFQALVIIGVAALFFAVPVIEYVLPLLLVSLGTAMLSASLALFTASLCSTQPQMHTVSTFLVLLFSAIGGSMVPRFMMPGWLQDIGVATPNYWVIEGFYGILARGQSVLSLWPVWTVIFGTSLLLISLAAIISHKMMRV